MRRTLAADMLALASLAPVHAQDAKPFTDAKAIDLVALLPPPANDSPQTKAELGEILTIQFERTPQMVEHAKAYDEETAWRYASELFGPSFTKDKVPKFSAFFDRVVETEGGVVDRAKKILNRPRPHMISDLVKPVVKLSSSGSYPSGHTTLGTMMGIILADMVPEKRAEIMARAWDFGHSRLLAGIHYPSDIEMSRISGTVIAATIMRQDDFKAEYGPAKAELRTDLGM
jgi:acid phosphatase (class A)